MLAPRSQKASSKCTSPISHGRVKLPGSFNFGGSLFCNIALHSSLALWSHDELNLDTNFIPHI